jgi:hypothetical protein
MKIRKRRQPLDFGALAEGGSADFDDAEAIEVAPDFDLSPVEPPPASPDEALFAPRTPATAARPEPAAPEDAPEQPAAPDAPPPVEMKRSEPPPAPPTMNFHSPLPPKARPAASPMRFEIPVSGPKSEPEARSEPEASPFVPPAAEIEPPPAPPVHDAKLAAKADEPAKAPVQPPAPAAEPLALTPAKTISGRPPEKPTAARPIFTRGAPSPAKPAKAAPAPAKAEAVRPPPARPETPFAPPPRTASAASKQRRSRSSVQAPSAGPIYAVAGVVSLIWTGAVGALAWTTGGVSSSMQIEPMMAVAAAALAAGPVAIIWLSAYLARQAGLLAAEAARAKSLADDMVSPAVIAAGRTGDLVQAVREEVARAGETAKEARETLLALRQALAEEAERLAEATGASVRTAANLAETLGRERADMAGLAQTLDEQTRAAVEALARQSKIVADASDLAETQLREAEASLTARAADLTAAAGGAADVARVAGEDLTRHIARLEAAGGGVAEQISVVEAGLVEQRAALVSASQSLRADQEVFAAEAESQTAKLSEFIVQARQSASEMGDRAIKGADALRGLIAEAADQFRDFADQAKIERDAFGASTRHSLEAVAAAAAEERAKLEAQTRAAIDALAKAAEETRAAAERHAESARAQVDQLSEAAFTAGQRANQVFEARLAEARDLIERSAQMVEQAGTATARKLDEGALAARGTLDELGRMLAEIEARAAQLPAAARQQAEEVRNAVIQGMDQLMEHARRTAEETEAIDLAFQERVRRNYEMLSEAVRLMGAVATTAPAPAPREARAPLRRPPEPADVPAPELPAAPAPKPSAEAGLRPRLRLTPTASDQEFSEVFESASGRSPPAGGEGGEGWTWKELLSSIDETPDEVPDSRIEATLINEINSMGIDPAALLPRARMEEVVDLLQKGDGDACRTLVRRLAPAATRRLARRLFTDPALKQQVRRYIARHQRLLDDAAKRDRGGLELGALLASDAGRAFLLLDAAAGDAS